MCRVVSTYTVCTWPAILKPGATLDSSAASRRLGGARVLRRRSMCVRTYVHRMLTYDSTMQGAAGKVFARPNNTKLCVRDWIINNIWKLRSLSVVLRITFLLLFFPSGCQPSIVIIIRRHHTSSILSSSYTSSLLPSSTRLRSCSSIGRAFW